MRPFFSRSPQDNLTRKEKTHVRTKKPHGCGDMISIDVQLTGAQVARALLDDPEEFYYVLAHIAEDESDERMRRIATDVAKYVWCSPGTDNIVRFLRIMADEMERKNG